MINKIREVRMKFVDGDPTIFINTYVEKKWQEFISQFQLAKGKKKFIDNLPDSDKKLILDRINNSDILFDPDKIKENIISLALDYEIEILSSSNISNPSLIKKLRSFIDRQFLTISSLASLFTGVLINKNERQRGKRKLKDSSPEYEIMKEVIQEICKCRISKEKPNLAKICDHINEEHNWELGDLRKKFVKWKKNNYQEFEQLRNDILGTLLDLK